MKKLNDCVNDIEDSPSFGDVSSTDLRQVAIGYIHTLNETVDRIKTADPVNSYKYIRIGHLVAKIDWIKMFFDIKEGELK